MKVIYLIALVVVVLVFSLPSRAGESRQDEITSKQAELSKLRKEIERYETKIKEHEKNESATLDLMDTYDRQANLLRKLIRKLQDHGRRLQKEIDSTRRSMADLSGQMTTLKEEYARYAASAYRYGRTHDLELLISSRSLNQALVRAEYLKKFSDKRRTDLDQIVSKRESVEDRNERLQRQLAEQRALLSTKAKEEARLDARLKKRKQVLASIRRDKNVVRQEMQRRVKEGEKLERIIADLIEKERSRKASKNKESGAPSASTFDGKRGKLPWPVSHGRIVARFGNQQHPVLKTITQNTGIDIALPVGSDVGVVAGGEVSTISWLPSFGNLVIVDHSGGFRTVYAHLSELMVAEGDRLAQGASLGKSGESISGPLLHFEIWKDREKLDPESWLVPRGLSQR
jgi:septal ring factor EnvC (AmiA/AmiB activator)